MLPNNFDLIYTNAIKHLLAVGKWQENQRTNSKVLSTHGYSFSWSLKHAPLASFRPLYLKTMAAEVAWMLSGSTSISWLKQYTSIWNAFADANDYIDTAYGYRWSSAFGVDQVANIINKLIDDPSSRQQVLLSWDPRVDNVRIAKNIPCPYTAVFNIIDGKLNCLLVLRSNDVLFGLPYDVGMYTLLSQAIANEVGVQPGELYYTIAHMHLYENQMEAANAINRASACSNSYSFEHDFTVTSIRQDPDAFVAHIVDLQSKLNYNPINVTAGLLPKITE